jgi:hypothetical protein
VHSLLAALQNSLLTSDHNCIEAPREPAKLLWRAASASLPGQGQVPGRYLEERRPSSDVKQKRGARGADHFEDKHTPQSVLSSVDSISAASASWQQLVGVGGVRFRVQFARCLNSQVPTGRT